MIKKQKDILSMPKTTPHYRITTTLLNQWQRIFEAEDFVKESENDTMSYEDKVNVEVEKRTREFLDLLNRIPTPDNEAMRKGREYERYVCEGLDKEFSPIVNGGAFQVKATKDIVVDGVPIRMYGVLDVLKAGRIMDIKRVGQYKYPKYKTSHQHAMYLFLIPSAIDFTYLICDDNIDSKNEEKRNESHHYENYRRENCEDIVLVVSQFLSWLKANNLFEVYTQNWAMY